MPSKSEQYRTSEPKRECSLITTLYAMQRHPTPPPKSRAERRRGKMQQTIEKAGAKAEAILRKLVESGKLQPGSLGKVSPPACNHVTGSATVA